MSTLQESVEMELRAHLAYGRVPIGLISIPLARSSRIEYADIHLVHAIDQQRPMCPVHQHIGEVISETDEVIVREIIRYVHGWRVSAEGLKLDCG